MSTSSLTLRSWLLGVVVAISIGMMLLYVRHRHIAAKNAQVLQAVYSLGGRTGRIGGFPLGYEYYIYFPESNSLNDDNVEDLLVLNCLEGNHYTTVSLRGTTVSDRGLRKLHDLDVNGIDVDPRLITDDAIESLKHASPELSVHVLPVSTVREHGR